MVCMTKTEWNVQVVLEKTGRRCELLGPSLEVDLFRPRRRVRPSWPEGPLRIAAMIRPSSPRRGPRLTMEVLQLTQREFGDSVEIVLFGVDPAAQEFLALPNDFAWYNAGTQDPESVALLLNETDIFVDFSQYQAMGLTAMEAMACGVAVVVPQAGGASTFARHETDALFVDTADVGACHLALRRLVQDHDLRQKLQRQAVAPIAAFVPERPALRLLWALFGETPLPARGSSAVALAALGDMSTIA
jgi:glycosyltransferase involved in cell wall biosynthesis